MSHFLKIFKVRKNVTIITPEDPYSKVEKDKYYLSSIYPNLPYFSLPSYPSGHGGYNQILRKVFFLTTDRTKFMQNIKSVAADSANGKSIKVEYYRKFRMI